jgi:hypothetical protein
MQAVVKKYLISDFLMSDFFSAEIAANAPRRCWCFHQQLEEQETGKCWVY